MNTNKQPTTPRSTIADLRSLMPTRALRPAEARRVAELQANRLRTALNQTNSSFDTETLGRLPRVIVTADKRLKASGSTQWKRGAWRIRINTQEPPVRQRFTLAHEFKHVLDAPKQGSSYRSITKRIDGQRQIEAICDYFAACLLMPKSQLKRLWGEGIHDLELLAAAFDVSQVAMTRRLRDLHLIDSQARSLENHLQHDWARGNNHRRSPHRRRFYRSRSRSWHEHLMEAA